MKSYACNKCGSTDVFINDRRSQKALICGDCGAWLKWIGNTELAVKEWALHNRLSPWNLKQIKIYHLARVR